MEHILSISYSHRLGENNDYIPLDRERTVQNDLYKTQNGLDEEMTYNHMYSGKIEKTIAKEALQQYEELNGRADVAYQQYDTLQYWSFDHCVWNRFILAIALSLSIPYYFFL